MHNICSHQFNFRKFSSQSNISIINTSIGMMEQAKHRPNYHNSTTKRKHGIMSITPISNLTLEPASQVMSPGTIAPPQPPLTTSQPSSVAESTKEEGEHIPVAETLAPELPWW
uniref:Uncharacterized protein n=1 Tax=Arundo donax TaxID=35708 RepID=A0A0A9S463_ARUDO